MFLKHVFQAKHCRLTSKFFHQVGNGKTGLQTEFQSHPSSVPIPAWSLSSPPSWRDRLLAQSPSWFPGRWWTAPEPMAEAAGRRGLARGEGALALEAQLQRFLGAEVVWELGRKLLGQISDSATFTSLHGWDGDHPDFQRWAWWTQRSLCKSWSQQQWIHLWLWTSWAFQRS